MSQQRSGVPVFVFVLRHLDNPVVAVPPPASRSPALGGAPVSPPHAGLEMVRVRAEVAAPVPTAAAPRTLADAEAALRRNMLRVAARLVTANRVRRAQLAGFPPPPPAPAPLAPDPMRRVRTYPIAPRAGSRILNVHAF